MESIRDNVRRVTLGYKRSFQSSGVIGKIVLEIIPLFAAFCFCGVCTVSCGSVLPDATPTAESVVDDQANDRSQSIETREPNNDIAAEESVDTTESAPTREPAPTATKEPTNTPGPTATHLLPEGQAATVVSVIDGDTIDVEFEGQTYRVRYIGMDTPERGMPLFEESTGANEELVSGKTVILVKDVSETDRYGRLLRYVYLEDGTFVNAELVKQGYAQVATFPPDVQNEQLFRQLQTEAREDGVGLWGAVAQAPEPTSTPRPSNTPIPPTATSAPTQEIQPTATPIPAPTDTPVPLPTDTPIPQPTEPPAPEPANVQISYIYFDGQVARVESDEYAQITNQGGSAVNLSGWRLNADDDGQDFWFPSFDLQPGQSCRVYTNEYHPDTCGFSFGSGQALWNNSDRECGHLFDPSGVEVSTYCY